MVENQMMSAAMAFHGQSGGTGSHSTSPEGNGLSISSGLHPVTGIKLKEQFNSGNDYAPKVRKPYTITKQRERWTEEEHKKFLESLKLYGRAWRKIEEHVGTKTAVQIRSHAQKFFSKVTRDSNGSDSVDPVDIPPPRPKRKPMHPYPRKVIQPPDVKTLKLESPVCSSSPNSAICDHENQSPTSVLSIFASETLGSTDSDTLNDSLSPMSAFSVNKSCLILNDPKTVLQEGVPDSAQFTITTSKPSVMNSAFFSPNNTDPIEETAGTRILKLFGRTVLVTDYHKPFFSTTTTSRFLFPEMHGQEHTRSSISNFGQDESSADNAQPGGNSMTEGPNDTPNHIQHQSGDSNLVEARAAAFVLCSFMPHQMQELEEEHGKQLITSCSSTALVNVGRKSESSESETENHPLLITKCERSKGFVPYKSCVAERDGFCSR